MCAGDLYLRHRVVLLLANGSIEMEGFAIIDQLSGESVADKNINENQQASNSVYQPPSVMLSKF